ncbi:toxin VasX [Pseudomonas sp. MBLB4123]|uniref:toxin VasX n=1 Tax=Pseudomonas sp. MBLB4123 TaxID=3451557 RepID=UPI003F74FE32
MTAQQPPRSAGKDPNTADKSSTDAKSASGSCPLMKNKVQLLPLRYGLVERLDPSTKLAVPYKLKSRPLGIRLLRDGWLYVIDNGSGYLHEYRVEKGQVTKFIWKGKEAAQDKRQGAVAEPRLLFPRGSNLHVCYAEVQWTAYKCSQMLKSREERDRFMQFVSLGKADCEKGAAHLLTAKQAQQWLAEVAEQPSQSALPAGAHAEEGKDYCWEHQPLYRPTQIGAVKQSLLADYEHDHLYLVFKDSIGVMRDLAEEQDKVVGWIEQWSEQQRKELKYVMGSYIETLMEIGEKNAEQHASNAFFDKTTPAQRETVYDYINARNRYTWQKRKHPEKAGWPGYGFDAKTNAARLERDSKKQTMIGALGEELYEELEDDIEALEDESHATLEGRGLGARGIHDLVHHEEMKGYLARERTHLQRWTARLERITDDRVSIFTKGEYHLSAWYFDPEHDDQLMAALVSEQHCTRDLCRTDESLAAIGEYFHTFPYYVLPAFQTRITDAFVRKQAPKVVKWLRQVGNLREAMSKAIDRQNDIEGLFGSYWAKSLNLPPQAQQMGIVVNAAYVPALSMRIDKWLQTAQTQLHTGGLSSLLDDFDKHANHGQRLGQLFALRQQGAWLDPAKPDEVQRFKDNLARFNGLIAAEDDLIKQRNQAKRDSKRRSLPAERREQAKRLKQAYNQQLATLRTQRNQLRLQLEGSLSPTSTLSNGHNGLRIRGLDSAQHAALENEIRRMSSGQFKGYGTSGTYKAAFKNAWLPSILFYVQLQNAMAAWSVWHEQEEKSMKDMLIFAGVLSGTISAGLSAYQGAHIAMVDTVLKSLNAAGPQRSGALFAARLGKLGLALGTPISFFAAFGALGTTLRNWSQWTIALRAGTAGERVGAAMALAGDLGTTGVNTAMTLKGGADLVMLSRTASKLMVESPALTRRAAFSAAWATRGVRFMSFAARISPWGLVFTGLQLGGEILFNFFNLDDHQRWLLQSCWGKDDNAWDQARHYQELAEATLKPVISDTGLEQDPSDGEQYRTYRLDMLGLRSASLAQHPLLLTAELRSGPQQVRDVGLELRENLRVLSHEPLSVQLRLPADWVGAQSLLSLRLVYQPEMAVKPLNSEGGYLHYSVPLTFTPLKKPIAAAKAAPPASSALGYIDILPEHLHA